MIIESHYTGKHLMATTTSFEKELHQNGFQLESGERECDHSSSPSSPTYIWYVQTCPCCTAAYYREQGTLKTVKSKDLAWYKYSGCEDCMDSELSSLSCGGHYGNFRLFEVSASGDREMRDETDFGQHPLEPNKLVYDDEN